LKAHASACHGCVVPILGRDATQKELKEYEAP